MQSMSDRTRKEYARRINAALDFIDRNLGDDIKLVRLAAEADFSPFHFHRIFTALIGEPGGTPAKPRFVFDLYVPVKPL